jgi:hypothetical protein
MSVGGGRSIHFAAQWADLVPHPLQLIYARGSTSPGPTNKLNGLRLNPANDTPLRRPSGNTYGNNHRISHDEFRLVARRQGRLKNPAAPGVKREAEEDWARR